MRRIAILTISLLAALPAFSQAPPAAPAGAAGASGAVGPTGPHPKSAAENNALVAVLKTTDPAAQAQAAEAFLKNYPDTDYKATALLIEAQGYHDAKQDPKAIVAGELAIDADPKSYDARLLLAEIYSRTTRSTDLDMDDKLTRSDKYAKEALALLATAQKPKADLSDADWAAAKQGEEARAWLALGFSSLLHKKYDDAKTNFQKGISLYPDPLDMLYIERAYTDAKRYDDALAWIDKAAASPNANDTVKRISGSDKTRVQDLKKKQQQ